MQHELITMTSVIRWADCK